MSVEKKLWGTDAEGREYSLYTITSESGRLQAQVSDLGAVLVRLFTPNRSGVKKDIVLGFEDVEHYLLNPPSFGATVGPNANRIANASFEIDGVTYHLPVNNGVNNLHSDKKFYKRLFAAQVGQNSVTFSISLPDGDAGFPGNRDFQITYTLTDDEIRIDYRADSDKKTILNLTNHSYFNLAGEDAGSILDQELQLDCTYFTPVVKGAIPTGELRAVAGTPLDFRTSKPIGRDIAVEDEQLALVGGYDHNFVIDGYREDGVLRRAGEAYDPSTGRVMEVLTTTPGIQFYTSNTLSQEGGKEGRTYGPRSAFALETQFFPDSIHHENFPSPVFGSEKPYIQATVYRFPACR